MTWLCHEFSASFCHQSINHPVCKSQVGTYDGRYFSVEKNSLRLRLSHMSTRKASNLVLPFVKMMFIQSSSAPINSTLLFLLGNAKEEDLKELWCDFVIEKG